MLDGRKILALTPARAGSKGLPDKNIREMCGKPLLAWPVQAALASALVDAVVVSTDSERYAAVAQQAGARVPFLRPAALATDEASSTDVIVHALNTLEAMGEHYDYLVVLEPTSPTTEAADVDEALRQLNAARDTADVIVGVTPLVASHPLYSATLDAAGRLVPYDERFRQGVRRQDLPPLYMLDGTLYITCVEAFRRTREFYGDRTLGYVTPKWKSHEIDDLEDFLCVEAILRNKERILQALADDAS